MHANIPGFVAPRLVQSNPSENVGVLATSFPIGPYLSKNILLIGMVSYPRSRWGSSNHTQLRDQARYNVLKHRFKKVFTLAEHAPGHDNATHLEHTMNLRGAKSLVEMMGE